MQYSCAQIQKKIPHCSPFLLIHTHQDDAKAPEVARLVISGVVKKFRRGVLQREAWRLQRSAARWKQARKPKINHFQQRVLSLIGKKDILRKGQRKKASRRKEGGRTTYLALLNTTVIGINFFFSFFFGQVSSGVNQRGKQKQKQISLFGI